MRAHTILIAILAAAACAGAQPRVARAPEVDAPASVRERVTALLGADARIAAEGPADRRTYEAAIQTKLEIELDPAGNLTHTEVAVPVAALPAAVASAAAARGQITEAELVLTAAGVGFEVEVKTASGTVEIMLDSAGAIVTDQADDDDDDDDDGDDD